MVNIILENKNLYKIYQSKLNNTKYQHNISVKDISSLLDIAEKDSVSKIIAAGVILNKYSKVLIVKRSEKEDFLPGILEFPSGHLEDNEDLLDGLAREIKEETSYEAILIDQYINHFDYTSISGKRVRQFNFLVKLNYNKEPILNSEEHQDFYWCNLEEAIAIGCDKTILDCLEIIYQGISNVK